MRSCQEKKAVVMKNENHAKIKADNGNFVQILFYLVIAAILASIVVMVGFGNSLQEYVTNSPVGQESKKEMPRDCADKVSLVYTVEKDGTVKMKANGKLAKIPGSFFKASFGYKACENTEYTVYFNASSGFDVTNKIVSPEAVYDITDFSHHEDQCSYTDKNGDSKISKCNTMEVGKENKIFKSYENKVKKDLENVNKYKALNETITDVPDDISERVKIKGFEVVVIDGLSCEEFCEPINK